MLNRSGLVIAYLMAVFSLWSPTQTCADPIEVSMNLWDRVDSSPTKPIGAEINARRPIHLDLDAIWIEKQLHSKFREVRIRVKKTSDSKALFQTIEPVLDRLIHQRQHDQVCYLLEHLIAYEADRHGERSFEAAQFQLCLAIYSILDGDSVRAALSLERVLAIFPEIEGEQSDRLANGIEQLVEPFLSNGEVALVRDALSVLRKVRREREGEAGDRDVAKDYEQRALKYQRKVQHEVSLALFEHVLEIRRDFYGEQHPLTGQAYFNVADALLYLNRFGEAKRLHNRALEIRLACLGEACADTALSQVRIAGRQYHEGNLLPAIDNIRRAYKTQKAIYGNSDEITLKSAITLAAYLLANSELDSASRVLSENEQTLKSSTAELRERMAIARGMLGVKRWERKEFANARIELERAASLFVEFGNEMSQHAADTNFALGVVLYELNEQGLARERLEETLSLFERLEGEQSLSAAKTRANLGWQRREQGDLETARDHLERALEIYTERGEFRSHGAIRSRLFLGVVAFDEGRYLEAQRILEQTVEESAAEQGAVHRETIAARLYLGAAMEFQGDLCGARICYETLFRHNANALLQMPDLAAKSYCRMFSTAIQQGDRAFAAEICTSLLQYCSLSRIDLQSDGGLPQAMRNDADDAYNLGISLALNFPLDRGICGAAAEWVLNRKPNRSADNAEFSAMADQIRDLGASEAFGQWLSLHRSYRESALRLDRTTRTGTSSRDDASLLRRIEAVRRRLSTSYAIFEQASPWATLNEVRKAIPPDEILIEFVRFERAREGALKKPTVSEYAAWIIPAHDCGEVVVVELGAAAPIDSAVLEIQQDMALGNRRDSTLAAFGEAKTAREIETKLAVLRRLAIDPLLPHIDSFDRWIVSPDGMLWFMPWGAAFLEDGQFMIERRSIECVTGGRDLLRHPRSNSMERSLVITNPDYNFDGVQANTPPLPTLSEPLATDAGRRTARIAMPIDDQRSRRSDLAALEKYLNHLPTIVRGKQSSEFALLSASQPRLVVLESDAYLPAQRDDMLLCAHRFANDHFSTADGVGLFMAGANNRLNRAHLVGNDGILTGSEILRADLRGTEIVVLNGAISGTPESKACDGFSELLRNFQFAGATSVVATLWKPPADDQALLMKDFWNGLRQGMSRSRALRAAQLARIKEHREKKSAAHPYYWAAPILVGID